MGHQTELIAQFLLTGQRGGEPVIDLSVEVVTAIERGSVWYGYYQVFATSHGGARNFAGSSTDCNTALQMALRVLAQEHGFYPGHVE